MPSTIRLILVILAFLLFVLAGFGFQHPRFGTAQLIAFGLALWILTTVVL